MIEPSAAGEIPEAKTVMTELRNHLARVLDEETHAIGGSTNLFSCGLPSLALMRLIQPLSQLAGRHLRP